MIKKIFSEPLVHFLLLGFFLFLYYDLTTSEKQFQDVKRITISSHELNQIKSDFKKEWKQDINDEQLNALILKKYYEKIVLNEAYSLGLERQDKIISDRLLTQMNFIMTNSSELVEPTEEELQKYYKDNIEDYSEIKNLSFSNVYFENQKDKKITSTLDLLKIAEVNATEASSFGDQCRLSTHVKNISFDEAKIIYGKYFASKLFNLKRGLWHSAIASKFGSHIIYVTDKEVSDAYIFDEVQDRVYEDYMNKLRESSKAMSYKKMSSQYSLNVKK